MLLQISYPIITLLSAVDLERNPVHALRPAVGLLFLGSLFLSFIFWNSSRCLCLAVEPLFLSRDYISIICLYLIRGSKKEIKTAPLRDFQMKSNDEVVETQGKDKQATASERRKSAVS